VNEMVERVARAMFRALDADPRFVGRADLTPEHPGWAQYCYQARAAIEAMREPSHEMVERGTIATLRLQLGKDADAWDATRSCWSKMIDGALLPDPGKAWPKRP